MSSPFWKYFHDSLRWPQIFRPGPLSAVVRGLALHMDDVREDILWLRRQWNPATADDDMIARYGESRGIIRWQFDTDESYRRRVVNAFAWHKLGGKVRGLERIFAENLFEAQVLPASRAELWAHFRLSIDVTGTVFDEQSYSLVFFLANEYKPARSKLEELITKSTHELPVYAGLGGVSRTGTSSRIWLPVPEPVSCPVRIAMACTGLTASSVHPVGPAPSAPRLPVRSALSCTGLIRSSVHPAGPAPRAPRMQKRMALACTGITRSSVSPMQRQPAPAPLRRHIVLAAQSFTRSSLCLTN